MRAVVDANILFSALIREGHTRKLLFIDGLELYAPEYLFEEFEKHEGELLEKSGRSRKEFSTALAVIRNRMTIVPASASKGFAENASEISPDKDDAAYFAIALAMNAVIWSNDKLLKKQNAVRVLSTAEMTALLKG